MEDAEFRASHSRHALPGLVRGGPRSGPDGHCAEATAAPGPGWVRSSWHFRGQTGGPSKQGTAASPHRPRPGGRAHSPRCLAQGFGCGTLLPTACPVPRARGQSPRLPPPACLPRPRPSHTEAGTWKKGTRFPSDPCPAGSFPGRGSREANRRSEPQSVTRGNGLDLWEGDAACAAYRLLTEARAVCSRILN